MHHPGEIIRACHHDCEAYRKSAWCPFAAQLDLGVVEGFHRIQRQKPIAFVYSGPDDRKSFDGHIYGGISETHNERSQNSR